MASKLQIINYGLRLAHQPKIFTLSDDNKRTKIANDVYDLDLEEVLITRNWSFAKKRVELGLDGTTPAYGWDYRFDKPSDYLKMIEVEGNYPYSEEESYILYNSSTLKVQYLFNQTNPNVYTPAFATTLGTRLAMDFAIAVAQDFDLAQKLEAVYTSRLNVSGSLDSQSAGPQEFEIEDWIEARDS